jgi:hypothetical protein
MGPQANRLAEARAEPEDDARSAGIQRRVSEEDSVIRAQEGDSSGSGMQIIDQAAPAREIFDSPLPRCVREAGDGAMDRSCNGRTGRLHGARVQRKVAFDARCQRRHVCRGPTLLGRETVLRESREAGVRTANISD